MAGDKGAAKAERIELLDALRGFALCGILLANILYWSGWIFMQTEQRIALAGESGVELQSFFHHAFVDGKFYTLFSFLFGIGFALQLERLTKRGLDGLRIFRRRLLVLLAIGLVHMVLIWDGDILTLYALLGLLLPFFRKWSDRSLAAAAAVLIFAVPSFGYWLFEVLGWRPHIAIFNEANRWFANWGGNPDDAVSWLRREDLESYFKWVLSGWPFAIGTRLESWRIPKVLGIMLIGLIAGRNIALGDFPGRKILLTVLGAGAAIGVPLAIAYGLEDEPGQNSLSSVLGTVPLAFAYAAAFALAWPWAKPVLSVFAAPGRMALTNYLTHSLLGILLFYGIGFGLVGHLQPIGFYGVALAIVAGQIIFSRWWLSRFEQGPMERLWRAATYRGL
jgi:uncharacterized protein